MVPRQAVGGRPHPLARSCIININLIGSPNMLGCAHAMSPASPTDGERA
jgi:hypothetical protein